jgi:hypothetical protein
MYLSWSTCTFWLRFPNPWLRAHTGEHTISAIEGLPGRKMKGVPLLYLEEGWKSCISIVPCIFLATVLYPLAPICWIDSFCLLVSKEHRCSYSEVHCLRMTHVHRYKRVMSRWQKEWTHLSRGAMSSKQATTIGFYLWTCNRLLWCKELSHGFLTCD